MRFIRSFITAAVLWSVAGGCFGQGNWQSIPVFSQTPLEAKLGVFDDSSSPNGLGVVLWNDGNNNRLDAITIPPPYDGSGVTVRGLENTATLFALGDICTQGTNVVVPYIKDFNVQTARYDGTNWSFVTVPGTQTNNFDSADCMVTQAGVVVAGHDLTDSETELFRSTNGGESYTFYARYGGVSGPFDGAPREPLASSGLRYVMGLNQQPSGQIRATRIDTAQNPPAITHTNITQTSAPPGSFQFVKESSARYRDGSFFFTYNADGNARLAVVPALNPAAFISQFLFAVASAGSQLPFVGGGLLPLLDPDGTETIIYAYWTALTLLSGSYTPPGMTDTNYPLTGVGGPVDTCLVENARGQQHAFFLGPRVGTMGTDLHVLELETTVQFRDGFESGDVSAWTQCD